MVVAFVDDSGSGGDSKFSILAGYSASDITWSSFWPDWQDALNLDPKIEYFKMSEAESLKGQFLGFSPEKRTNRLNRFIDVILAHDLQEASVAIPMKDYREIVYPVLPKSHTSPYYFAFIGMVSAFAGINRHSGSTQPTDFVFDQQDGMETKALRLYHRLKEKLPLRQLGQVAYHSDHEMLPLQAADLIAWQIRRFRCTPDEPIRDELTRLHSGLLQPFQSTIRRRELEKVVTAMMDNVPNLREEHGDEFVDKFFQSIKRRNEREGLTMDKKFETKMS
jgi:hypothetical protein